MSEAANILLHPRHAGIIHGHEAAERAFLDAIGAERIHHAWLLTGPKGIGKASLAYRIAKYALAKGLGGSADEGGLFGEEALPATAPASLDVEVDHPAVMRIASQAHGSLKVLDAEILSADRATTVIPVDAVRNLLDFFTKTAAEEGWRVAIIDAADDLNRSSANALLKALEEPPAKCLLLLVSHSPGRLLATIRSRCRVLRLTPVSEVKVRSALVERFPDLPPDDLATLAELSDGAIGKALGWANTGGLDVYREVSRIYDALPRVSTSTAHKLANRLAGKKSEADYRNFLEFVAAVPSRAVRSSVRGSGDAPGTVGKILNHAGVDRWLEVWEKIRETGERADARNLDRKQVVLSILATIESATAK